MTDKQREIAGSKSEHKAAKKAYEEQQSSSASQQEAVERSQSWADLSRDDSCLLYTSPSPRD